MEASTIDPRWKDLYRTAGIAAILSAVVILLGVVAYFIWPYAPGSKSTESIFLFLQAQPLGGSVSLDLILLVGDLLGILLFLAFYVSLRSVNESFALIALTVGLIGVVLLVPDRPIPELFALSRSYVATTDAASRGQLVAAGDALLSLFSGIGWFMSNLLGALSLLVSSLLMLRSSAYSKATAIVGIVTNVAAAGFFIPVIGTFLLFLSLPGYLIWYIQLARRFLQLGRKA